MSECVLRYICITMCVRYSYVIIVCDIDDV